MIQNTVLEISLKFINFSIAFIMSLQLGCVQGARLVSGGWVGGCQKIDVFYFTSIVRDIVPVILSFLRSCKKLNLLFSPKFYCRLRRCRNWLMISKRCQQEEKMKNYELYQDQISKNLL